MLSMEETRPEARYPRWTEADEVDLMLLHKKLPEGPRRLLASAAEGGPVPADAVDATAQLDRLCDAFRRAPLIILDSGSPRLDVADPAWVLRVLRR